MIYNILNNDWQAVLWPGYRGSKTPKAADLKGGGPRYVAPLLTSSYCTRKLTGVPTMKTFGERIRELREKHDKSVRELAKELKVSAPFLSDIELGRRHPSKEVLDRLASILETTPDDLKKHDSRPPVQELKRIAASNPAMGFALRKVVDEGVNPDELFDFLKHRGKGKKT
jgi:transcriptional regulator with XRE-family HTH domain